MYYIVDNELYHHGILGQRWGVRRYQRKDGSLTLAGKRRAKKLKAISDEKKANDNLLSQYEQETAKKYHKNASASKLKIKAEIAEMTNEDLNKAVTRHELEQKYMKYMYPEVIASDKSKEKAKKIVSEILEGAAKNVGADVASYYLGDVVNIIARALGTKEPVTKYGSSKGKNKQDNKRDSDKSEK